MVGLLTRNLGADDVHVSVAHVLFGASVAVVEVVIRVKRTRIYLAAGDLFGDGAEKAVVRN